MPARKKLINGPSIAPRRDEEEKARKARKPYFEPLRSLKARTIEEDLRNDVNNGLFSRPAWTFHELAATCSLLGDKVRFWKAQIAALDWKITISADAQGEDADPAKVERAEAQKKVLFERYDRILNLKQALKHLATARFYGFAVLRIGDLKLEPVMPWNVIHDIQWLTQEPPTCGWYFNQRAEMSLWRDKMPRMDVGGYVIRNGGDCSMLELMKMAFRVNRIMDFREKDLENAAKRQVLILTGGNLPDEGEERNELMGALRGARDGESAVIAKGDPNCPTEIIHAPASRGLMYYNEAISQLDEQMTKAVTGGMLTMLAMPTGIGEGASSQHADTLKALVADEVSEIKAALWEAIDEPELRMRGLLEPGERPLASFDIGGEEVKDPSAGAALLATLKQAGYKVSEQDAGELVGLTLEEAPEPSGAPGGGFAGFGGIGNRAKSWVQALRNRAEEVREERRKVDMDAAFFRFIDDLAKKYGGDEVADEAWIEKMASLIESAPPETFVDSDTLQAWLEDELQKGAGVALYVANSVERVPAGNGNGGQFTGATNPPDGKIRPREPETHGHRDNYGTTDEDKLAEDADKNMRRGLSVVTHLMRKKAGFEPKSMFRRDTGWIGIDYGEPGNKNKDWSGGHGLSHILSKHPGAERHLVDVLQNGDAYKHHKSDRKVTIVKDRTVVVLSKHRTGRLLITDYENASEKQIAEYTTRGKYHVKGEN